jgi:diphosphomevalonate decarboxylase
LHLSESQLSAIARLGSGSAARSIPGGFVEWQRGIDHDSSFASSIESYTHWNLVDLVAIVSQEHKVVGSTEGHLLANTSPLQAARVQDTPRRLAICKLAIKERDFESFAAIVELDTLMMHSVMNTGTPGLFYWLPPTLLIMRMVKEWRQEGLPVAYSIDAGPNVHVITLTEYAQEITARLKNLPDVITVLSALPGEATRLLARHLEVPQVD